MKKLRKWAFAMLLAVGGFLSLSPSTQAAKPYEYTFIKDTNTFNDIASINKMVITFDDTILQTNENAIFNPNTIDKNSIYIVQTGSKDRVNIIDKIDITGKKLTVEFKNLEFIDYSGVMDYTLMINKEALRFDQLTDYKIPFKIYDVLPGFKSTFIDTTSSVINSSIFKVNAPRDVMVHVPKIFIRGIETIHHYDGILPDPLPKEDGNITKDPVNNNKQSNPELTNIDILADTEATRLKVTFKNSEEYSRDLLRRSDVDGFTMGQAGINDITYNQTESLDEFQLKAYSDEGRFLEQRNFKLKVTDPKNDYIINDYLPEPTEEFGQTYSLYDLMADRKLLENIITRIPVSQLDSLGITYKVADTDLEEIDSYEKLIVALANPNVKTIKLSRNITLDDDLLVDHSVTIEGGYKLYGDVILGKGQDINVRLNDITVDGDLTVDVGANGSAILDNVTVLNGRTIIISGGVNSVHLSNFNSPNGIYLKNRTPLRVVNASEASANDINISSTASVTLEGTFRQVDVTQAPLLNLLNFDSRYDINLNNTTPVKVITSDTRDGLAINGTGDVTLEGSYTSVYANSNTTLNTSSSTTIEKIYVDSGKILNIDGSAENIKSVQAEINGNVTFPSGLTIDTVTAEAVATAYADKIVVKFNRDMYKSSTGSTLSNSDLANYFTVTKNGTALSVGSYSVDANDTFSIVLNSNIRIGDVVTVGLKRGATLYDVNGNPITGVTRDVLVGSGDRTFVAPTPSISGNQLTLQFAEDLDLSTVIQSDFSVSGYTINGFQVNTDNVVLTLNSAPTSGQSVAYYISNAHITDKVGNKLSSNVSNTVTAP